MLIFCYSAILITLISIIVQMANIIKDQQADYEKFEKLYYRHMQRKDDLLNEIKATYEHQLTQIKATHQTTWNTRKLQETISHHN